MTFKAGVYYIGDPCYIMNRDTWSDFCNLVFKNLFDQDEPKFKDQLFFMTNPKYGDGTYYDNYGKEYFVDSGCIGIFPEELIEKEAVGGHIVIFDKDFKVDCKNYVLKCDDIFVFLDNSVHDEQERDFFDDFPF